MLSLEEEDFDEPDSQPLKRVIPTYWLVSSPLSRLCLYILSGTYFSGLFSYNLKSLSPNRHHFLFGFTIELNKLKH